MTRGVLAATLLAGVAACTGAGEPEHPGADPFDGPLEECVADVWIHGVRDCWCPEDSPWYSTAECEAPDCRETDVMGLLSDRRGFALLVRWSESWEQLSGRPPPSESMWEVTDAAELVSDYGDHEVVWPITCDTEQLVLEPGRPDAGHFQRAPDGLANGLVEAHRSGGWEAVTYEPP